MIIHRVKLKNFMLHKDSIVNFSSGINAIVGENGAGKSSIIMAIGVALFNFNYLNLNNLITDGMNQGEIEVWCDNFKVTRRFGRESLTKLELYSGEEIVQQIEGYQKVYDYLEAHALNVSTAQFETGIYITSRNLTNIFLQTDVKRRKSVFDNLIGISKFETIFRDLGPVVSTLRSKVNLLSGSISSLENIEKNTAQLNEQISADSSLITKLESDWLSKHSSFDVEAKLLIKYKEQIVAAQRVAQEIRILSKEILKLESDINIQKERLEYIRSSICPECKQPISVEETRLNNLNNSILDTKMLVDVRYQRVESLMADRDGIPPLPESLVDEKKLNSLEKELDQLKMKIISTRSSRDTKINLVTSNTELIQKLNEQQRELERVGEQIELLSSIREKIRGLGPMLSKSILEQISELATTNLRSMMGTDEVSLVWNIDYTLTYIIKDTSLDFTQLSEGEKVKVALAVRFALSDANNLHLLILDEPTINLDVHSRESVREFITRSQCPQIIVVSHDETFSDFIDRTIVIGKEEQYSTVKD